MAELQGAGLPARLSDISVQDLTHDDSNLQHSSDSVFRDSLGVPLGRHERQRKARSKLFIAAGLLVVYVLSAVLLFTICHPTATSSVFEGVQHRRLAEGGGEEADDLTPPSTPEILDMCLDFENQLNPVESHLETLRTSPVMVQAFLDELEGGNGFEYGLGPASYLDTLLEENSQPSGSLLKRLAPGDANEDGEGFGPASKVAKNDFTPSPPFSNTSSGTNESFPSSADTSTGSGGFESYGTSSNPEFYELLDFPDLLLPMLEAPDAVFAPPFASAGASASSAVVGPGPSSAFSGDDKAVHPWLNVPVLLPDVQGLDFRPEKMTAPLFSKLHAPLMVKIHEMLVRPVLDYSQAIRLLVFSEILANHAFHKMRGPVSSRRPTDAAESLGRRFMVFQLLHSASKTLRQPWPQQQWWRDLASVIPSTCPFMPGDKGMNSYSQASVTLAVQLSAAIELYKSGSAPSNDEIIDIMRKLFCSPESPHHFKRKSWDPWRRDDDPSSSST
ncbi:hypothetical protein Emed_003913 [Eimeria media]